MIKCCLAVLSFLLFFVLAALDCAEPISVVWEGTYLDFNSISHVNREMTNALSRLPSINLTRVRPKKIKNDWKNFDELVKMSDNLTEQTPKNVQVTIRHAYPPMWSKPKTGKWVLMQPWEFGSIPALWVDKVTKIDEVWVPTHCVKQMFVDSGVPAEKVFVVPNGINPEIFHPEVKPYPLSTEKKFKFLFLGGTLHRKGVDILLKSYRETFDASDDVCLVIKDFGVNGNYHKQTMDAQIRELQAQPGGAEILYFQDDLDVEAIAGLYAACDCLVHPYRGEGFAMTVLEAMACGTPVIVTAGGATDDFVADSCGWLIPAGRSSLGNVIYNIKLAGEGWFLEPDGEILGDTMRQAVENPTMVREKGEAAAKLARDNWTWDHAAFIAAERIRSLIEPD